MQAKQQGIALIIVLMVSIVFSVVALYLNHTSRQVVHLALSTKQRMEALDAAQNAEAKLLFTMLTNPLDQSAPRDYDWNFYGSPFRLEGDVVASVQDNSGLFNVATLDPAFMSAYFVKLGASGSLSRELVSRIADWQDADGLVSRNGGESGEYQFGPRNSRFAEEAEINWIPQIPVNIRPHLKQDLSIHGAKYFNPLNSPDRVLDALVEVEPTLQTIYENRRNKNTRSGSNKRKPVTLTREDFIDATSDVVRLKITASNQDIYFSQRSVVRFNREGPIEGPPVVRLEVKEYNTKHAVLPQ